MTSLDTAFEESLESAPSNKTGAETCRMLWPHLQPILERLAISLTQGLGPTKARKLVDFRLGRSGLPRLAHRSGRHRDPGSFRALDRYGEVCGTGARSDLSHRRRGPDGCYRGGYLPAALKLTPAAWPESGSASSASLFPDEATRSMN